MKTKEIKGGEKEIILIDAKIGNVEEIRSLEAMYSSKFIERLSEITEEKCEKIVKRIDTNKRSWINYSFFLPKGGQKVGCVYNCCRSAKDSFLTLLEKNGVLYQNPLGPFNEFDKKVFNHSKEQFDKWKYFEKNVFIPECTLVFVKQ